MVIRIPHSAMNLFKYCEYILPGYRIANKLETTQTLHRQQFMRRKTEGIVSKHINNAKKENYLLREESLL